MKGVTGLLAVAVVFGGLAGQVWGQGYLTPGERRGDPKSPAGRPLAEPGSQSEELRRTRDSLKKEQDELDADEAKLEKKEAQLEKDKEELLELAEVVKDRLEAAESAVELGQQLGGVSERALAALRAAERARDVLLDEATKWDKANKAARDERRELETRSKELDRRIDAYDGLVKQLKEKPKGDPDSFAEIEKRAKELNKK